MVKGRGTKRTVRPPNRIVEFARTATEGELDAIVELCVRLIKHTITSRHFVHLIELGADLQQLGRRFGDA